MLNGKSINNDLDVVIKYTVNTNNEGIEFNHNTLLTIIRTMGVVFNGVTKVKNKDKPIIFNDTLKKEAYTFHAELLLSTLVQYMFNEANNVSDFLNKGCAAIISLIESVVNVTGNEIEDIDELTSEVIRLVEHHLTFVDFK